MKNVLWRISVLTCVTCWFHTNSTHTENTKPMSRTTDVSVPEVGSSGTEEDVDDEITFSKSVYNELGNGTDSTLELSFTSNCTIGKCSPSGDEVMSLLRMIQLV